jgi:23S rRNA pseudouridine1911/1915/1917 synthase
MMADTPPLSDARYTYTVTENAGERLDKLITALLTHHEPPEPISRERVQALIKDGLITVNGHASKPAYRVEAGDQLIYPVPQPPPPPVYLPESIPLDVLYEDADLAAINKLPGMVVHPALGHSSGTLVNAILARWPETAQVGEPGRAGIVHRLDKETSGVILIAKTEAARLSLAKQFKARRIKKRYIALVHHTPATPTGEINAPIGRDPKQRKKMAVIRDGRESISRYRILKHYGEVSLLEVLPQTGRTHQIRVHLAFIKTPVIGDRIYGYRRERGSIRPKRLLLHAEGLLLRSPSTGERIEIHAPLPADFKAILADLDRRFGIE